MMKRALRCVILVCLSTAVALAISEVVIRLVRPQVTMHPRWQVSEQYGSIPFPNRRMVSEQAGRWRFVHTTNRWGHRGPEVPIASRYVRANVVLLGDSYTFGHGVQDGEEYGAVLQRDLDSLADVVNLAAGGWGLAQETRRFYELGILYAPSAVVLQFCCNDPEDGLLHPVARVQSGRIVFRNASVAHAPIKSWLSTSVIQKSQLYNLVRNNIYLLFRRRAVDAEVDRRFGEGEPVVGEAGEVAYVELLRAFADDLARRRIPLIFLPVNGQLGGFPFITGAVEELADEGQLRVVDPEPWFEDLSDFRSPEGHLWGRVGHEIVGQHLAVEVRSLLTGDSPVGAGESATVLD